MTNHVISSIYCPLNTKEIACDLSGSPLQWRSYSFPQHSHSKGSAHMSGKKKKFLEGKVFLEELRLDQTFHFSQPHSVEKSVITDQNKPRIIIVLTA